MLQFKSAARSKGTQKYVKIKSCDLMSQHI